MKKYYFPILFLFAIQVSFAQNVNIPDPYLKDFLVNDHDPVIDTNGDGEIQVDEAEAMDVLEIDVFGNYDIMETQDLTGIEAFANITELWLRYVPDVTSIDVSSFDNLEKLRINNSGITSIDLSQNLLLEELDLSNGSFSSIDFGGNTALEEVRLHTNALTDVDLSNLTNLEFLWIDRNNLSTLDVSQNTNLITLMANDTQLSDIDVSSNTALELLEIGENFFVELDVSANPNLTYFNFFGSPVLTHVNLKNGNTAGMDLGEGFLRTPSLEVVCVDDENSLSEWNYQQAIDLGAVITTDCDFDFSQINTIYGEVKYDMGEGCEAFSASSLPLFTMKSVDENGHVFATLTDSEGNYSIQVGEGDYVTSLGNDLPSYFTVNPDEHNSSFTGFLNADNKDFCVEANDEIADLKITLDYKPRLGTMGPFPFGPGYYATIENMGTQMVDGEFHMEFDDDFFRKVSTLFLTPNFNPLSDQNGLLTYEFYDLKPFHKAQIRVGVAKNSWVDLEIGDTHDFTFSALPITNDITPADNVFVLNDTVFSAYDPNNKIVWEGEEIYLEEAEEYLHYTVNFQNTGNAAAQKVVVTDTLSSNLDWESLHMLSASHNYKTKIEIENDSERAIVHFTFNNIDLTYEDDDEEESQGYIAYKIRPKNGLEVGDVMKSPADIFFDENPPIRTNIAKTTIVEDLSVENPKLIDQVTLYPNPTTGMVYFDLPEGMDVKTIEIFSLNGKLIMQEKTVETLDITHLSEGMYFFRITDQKGEQALKRVLKK